MAMQRRIDHDRVVALRRQGLTYAEIAVEAGCTRQRVAQIVWQAAVTPDDRLQRAQRTVTFAGDPPLRVLLQVTWLPKGTSDGVGERRPVDVQVDLCDGHGRMAEQVTHLRDGGAPGEEPGRAGVS